MIRRRDLGLIRRILLWFLPLISAGCVVTFFFAKGALLLIGGEKYGAAEPILRALIPVLFFSFPGMLFGWPTLGAIDRVKETTLTTLITAAVQLIGLALLLAAGRFEVVSIALLRGCLLYTSEKESDHVACGKCVCQLCKEIHTRYL